MRSVCLPRHPAAAYLFLVRRREAWWTWKPAICESGPRPNQCQGAIPFAQLKQAYLDGKLGRAVRPVPRVVDQLARCKGQFHGPLFDADRTRGYHPKPVRGSGCRGFHYRGSSNDIDDSVSHSRGGAVLALATLRPAQETSSRPTWARGRSSRARRSR